MSMLDRPISESTVGRFRARARRAAHGRVQALPGSADRTGRPPEAAGVHHFGRHTQVRDYPDFVVNHQTAPNSGVGFLIGWRGKDGDKALTGEPNPRQWEEYAKNNCVFHYTLPETLQYMRNCNGPYLEWA